MKKSMKIFSLILCLALVLTAFAACGKEENKKDDEKETKASTTESTTVETTTEAPKGDATHDGKLIGFWEGVEEMTGNVNYDSPEITVKIRTTLEFKEDGTFVQKVNEEDYRQACIDTLLVEAGCETEEELDTFLQQNAGMSLDEMLDMVMADIPLTITGTWETDGEGNISWTYNLLEDEISETDTYTISDDGKTLVITEEDEDQSVTITLKKA